MRRHFTLPSGFRKYFLTPLAIYPEFLRRHHSFNVNRMQTADEQRGKHHSGEAAKTSSNRFRSAWAKPKWRAKKSAAVVVSKTTSLTLFLIASSSRRAVSAFPSPLRCHDGATANDRRSDTSP